MGLPREAIEADLPAITAIYGHHVETSLGTFEEIPPGIDEMTSRWRRTRERQLPYLVVERDGAVRGFSHAGPYRARSAYRHTLEDSVYVDPGWLRRGLASLLLEELIARCAGLGYRQMVAVIGGSDNAGSIRLHENCDFREVGILRDIGCARPEPGCADRAPCGQVNGHRQKKGPRGIRAAQV